MSDLINRDYAIDDLHSKSQLQIWDTEDVEVWINDLPSAEPERKKGEWIFKEDFRIVDGYDWKCDQCGSWQRYTSNYCPNCGARMKGEEK